jgi:hypothetical protein
MRFGQRNLLNQDYPIKSDPPLLYRINCIPSPDGKWTQTRNSLHRDRNPGLMNRAQTFYEKASRSPGIYVKRRTLRAWRKSPCDWSRLSVVEPRVKELLDNSDVFWHLFECGPSQTCCSREPKWKAYDIGLGQEKLSPRNSQLEFPKLGLLNPFTSLIQPFRRSRSTERTPLKV